jgi:anti-anti-sigma factor
VIPASKDLQEKLARFASKHENTILSLDESADPRGIEVRVDGSIDGDTSQDFRDIVALAMAAARDVGCLVIELSSLSYISSTGVGALTNLLSESRRLKVPFYLRDMPDQAKAVFDLLGFSSFFTFLSTEAGKK